MTWPTSSNESEPERLSALVEAPVPHPRWIRWTVLFAAGAIIIWVLLAMGGDWRQAIDWSHPMALPVFGALMATLPIFGFPISAFYIFAGAAFPVSLAVPVGLVSLAVNMSVSYGLARYVWREPLRRKFEPRWPKVFALDERSTTRITILVRAVPGVPYAIQNYLLGAIATPFPTYLGLSLGIQGCIMTGVILTTRGLLDQNGQLALWGGLTAGITLVCLRLVWRREAT